MHPPDPEDTTSRSGYNANWVPSRRPTGCTRRCRVRARTGRDTVDNSRWIDSARKHPATTAQSSSSRAPSVGRWWGFPMQPRVK